MNTLSSFSLRNARMPFRFSRSPLGTPLAFLGALFAAVVYTSPVAAQPTPSAPIPKGSSPIAPATKGTTDVAGTGTFAAQLKEEERKAAADATDASLSGGGLFTSGNSRSLTLTAGGKLRLRRGDNQFSASFFGNYGRAASKPEQRVEDTVANLQGLLRYDYFFAESLSLFLQATGRHDKFQGLDFRLTVDPGVAAYLIDTKDQRAWVEAGLQLQYDVRNAETLAKASPPVPPPHPGVPTPPTVAFANARFYAGYENKLYDGVAFTTGVEYIQNLHQAVSRYRLNFDIGLKAKVSDKLAIATTYTMRFENQPLPTVQKADSIAAVTFIYTFF